MRVLLPLLPALRRRARRLTRSEADAEDLVQDVLVRLMSGMAKGRRIDDLPRYAMRALSNEAHSRWRRAEQTEELSDDLAVTPPTAETRLTCAETLRAIEQLPRPQADLMRRVVAGETSPKALARATGLPVGTVMSRLARARAALRTQLD